MVVLLLLVLLFNQVVAVNSFVVVDRVVVVIVGLIDGELGNSEGRAVVEIESRKQFEHLRGAGVVDVL